MSTRMNANRKASVASRARVSWRRAAIFAATVFGVAGATGSLTAYAADSQNEVTVANNTDGTRPFTAVDADNPDSGNEGVGLHTPGLDSGANNRVVRTYDLASYEVNWDVNEAAGENVVLTLTIEGHDAVKANVSWALSVLDELAGCGADPQISQDGLTLTCLIGDVPEGSHGTVFPQVELVNGVDGTPWFINAELTSDNAQAATGTTQADPYYVSEAPKADWVKGVGGAYPLNGTDQAEGYLVWFPVGLNDLSQRAFPVKGTGSLESKAISFFDHATDFDSQVTLATQAQIDQVPQLSGSPCGTLDPANEVGFPTTDAVWTCSAPSYDNGYPVVEMSVAPGYSLVPPELNTNGKPNTTMVVTGQIVFFLPPAFLGAGPDFGPYHNWLLADPPSTNANDTKTPITVSGSTDVAETGTANNETTIVFSTQPIPGEPGGTKSKYLAHSAWFGRNYSQRANVGGDGTTDSWLTTRTRFGNLPGTPDSPVFWTPMFGETVTPYNQPADEYNLFSHPTDPPFSRMRPWSGQGQVHRGEPITLNLDVHAQGFRGIDDEPIHGCMTWNAAQIQLDEMPNFDVGYWNGTNTSRFIENVDTTPNRGPLANLLIGGNAGAFHRTDRYSTGPAIEPFDSTVLSAAGLKVQFALDPTVQPDDPNQKDPTYTGETGGIIGEYGSVAQNSVECNNSNPAGAARDWVDHDQVVAGSDGLYHYNMVRVIMEGTSFPWWNANQDLSSEGDYTDRSGFSLTVQGRVGADYAGNPTDVNHDYKALYLHSARGWGDLDANGQPELTDGSDGATPTCRSIVGSTDQTELEPGDDTDPGFVAPADGNGWCNQRYNSALEPNATPNEVVNATGSYKSSLDPRAFTARQETYWFYDSDHDRTTIVAVRPAVEKSNPAGPTQIIDNEEFATFEFAFSAIGSDTEALAGYTFTDDFPSWTTYDDNGTQVAVTTNDYYFVEFNSLPTTPGTTCETFPAQQEDPLAPADVTRVRCRFSQDDPLNPDGSTMPLGIPGGWTDTMSLTVQLRGGVALSSSPRRQRNIATVDTTGTITWEPSNGGAPADGAALIDLAQTDSGQADTYMPLLSDRAAFQKTVNDTGLGACVNGPDGTPLEGEALTAWQARCMTVSLDEDPSNLNATPPTLDTSEVRDGSFSFGLSYTNEGNSRLTNLRFVDVLPWNGDGASEPGSNSGEDGANPSTVGDARTPASMFEGDLGFKGVEGAFAYYVTADAPGTVSRDPDKAFTETVWCTWDPTTNSGVNVPGTAAGSCPTSPYDITAVFVQATDPGDATAEPTVDPEALMPGDTIEVTLALDTENAACDSLYTNTFGARVDQIALPVRSNDVSAMVQCVTYNLGNQVWFDKNNDGKIGTADDGEYPIADVNMLLFNAADGAPVDANGDNEITAADAIQSMKTDENGLYLFDNLKPGEYVVGVDSSNWAAAGALFGHLSSDPTSTDPNDNTDNDDNGYPAFGMVVSGVITLGNEAEPEGENPSNNDNDVTPDNRSNLTDDFGFYLPNFDLALRKTLADGQSEVVSVGDLATFKIEVFNQGDITGDQITVIDYLPAGLELADEDWTAGEDNTASIALPGAIKPGESTVVEITLKVLSDDAADLVNYAEISAQTGIDDNGDPIKTPIGTPIQDVDSVPDTTNDDTLIDNEIDLTAETGDEDDHDIAKLVPATQPTTTTTTPVVPPTTPKTGFGGAWQSISLSALLIGTGVPLMLLGRRRRRHAL